jgi:hypothetical protein
VIRVPRELRPLVLAAVEAGWTVERTGGGHLRFKSPSGALVFTPSTPGGGRRSIENCRAELRRKGLNLPR